MEIFLIEVGGRVCQPGLGYSGQASSYREYLYCRGGNGTNPIVIRTSSETLPNETGLKLIKGEPAVIQQLEEIIANPRSNQSVKRLEGKDGKLRDLVSLIETASTKTAELEKLSQRIKNQFQLVVVS